ncbi:MAG: glycine cleavage system protein GcvH [Actinomycetota bacterium]|nr:glycine cleavage system protein GcvH [Actinomycetota bacterium]MDA8397013.1 glycine cleavage system protein GcvH [Actinomycetota bacterium]
MEIREDRSYTKDHEWAVREGNTLRVGITDYAQDALGDVVFVQLPAVGAQVTTGTSFAEVESTKSVSDIYAPATGKVLAVNTDLESQPELINSAPYEGGWIAVIELSDGADPELMSAADYATMTEV